ncbi:MAG: BON domain-containing protein [Parachlamydiaceae bacterium]
MSKLFTIIVLGSASILSADQYYSGYSNGKGYYQENQGQYSQQSNQEISKKVKEVIGAGSGWFSKRFEHVSFDVNNGTVTLKGTVDSEDNKISLEETVKKISGVTRVNNEITIARDTSDAYNKRSEGVMGTYNEPSQNLPQGRQINSK